VTAKRDVRKKEKNVIKTGGKSDHGETKGGPHGKGVRIDKKLSAGKTGGGADRQKKNKNGD